MRLASIATDDPERRLPGSPARLEPAEPGRRWVVVCSQGYTSSLAAAALCSLGIEATDLIGGVRAWRDEGLALVAGPTWDERIVEAGSRVDFRDLCSPHIEDEAAH